jgi:hypothetical protein
MRSRSQPLSGSEARPVSLLVSEESQYRHEDRRGEEAKVCLPPGARDGSDYKNVTTEGRF